VSRSVEQIGRHRTSLIVRPIACLPRPHLIRTVRRLHVSPGTGSDKPSRTDRRTVIETPDNDLDRVIVL
jgi:hypothetical protein